MKNIFLTLLNGFLIGIANLVPGVSGGTFALILGLYDKLLKSVSSINFQIFVSFFNLFQLKKENLEKFKLELNRIDIKFLFLIGLGIFLSTLGGAKVIRFFLQDFPEQTLGLFFGFILASLKPTYQMIEETNKKSFLLLLVGIFVSILPSFLWSNSPGSENYLIVFLSGTVAISAMILPGISGSYILLLLGQYQILIEKLTQITKLDSLLFLLFFCLGCTFGLLLFTKLVQYLLSRYKSLVMSFLLGLVLGSFYLLWPFKDFSTSQQITGRDGKVKKSIQIATAKNQIPKESNRIVTVCLILGVGTFLGVSFNKIKKRT